MKHLLTLGTVALLGIATIAFKTDVAKGYKVGDKASDFKLKNVIDDKTVSLSDYKDAKGYVVVFTCNHCPFAKKYEQRIIDLQNKYGRRGYPVVAISPNDPSVAPDDSPEKMKELALEKKYPFPYLFDEGQKVFPMYGATKTPHVYLLDKDLTVKYIGAIDDNVEDASAVKIKYLENAIDALANGKNPDPAETKAVGCSIKVKK